MAKKPGVAHGRAGTGKSGKNGELAGLHPEPRQAPPPIVPDQPASSAMAGKYLVCKSFTGLPRAALSLQPPYSHPALRKR